MSEIKLKKKRIFLIPLCLVLIGTVGILFHREQNIEGTFYLVVSGATGNEKTISDKLTVKIDGKIVIIRDDGTVEQQEINQAEKSFYLSGKKYFYNYNSGHLSLVHKIDDSTFESMELISETSPLFETYQKKKK